MKRNTVKAALKVGGLVLACFGAILSSSFAQDKDNVVRLASVNSPAYSGLLSHLLVDFEAKTGLMVDIYSGSDVYDVAYDGKADVVISHFGKADVEDFILEGYGSWPVMVFANQSSLIGPESDPANVKNATSLKDAFERIAETGAPFVVNSIAGVDYLTQISSDLANWSENPTWIVDEGVSKVKAVSLAEEKQGYLFWGAMPFLKYKAKSGTTMQIVFSQDPLMQRIMSATIVKSEKVPGVNTDGAEVLVDFLLAPETQASIAEFRAAGSNEQLWWPAGRDN